MRIGMPTTSYPARASDAAGTFVRTLARALVRRGHRIDVLAPAVEHAQSLHDDGIHVHRIRYAPRTLQRTFGRFGAPDNLVRDPLAWLGVASFPVALARAITVHGARWDAIVSHFVVPCSVVAARFARGRPHVAVAHGTDAHVAAALPGLASLVRRSGALVCVSRSLADRLGAPDAIIQPLGIELRERRAMRPSARFVALCLSRLVAIKGIDSAIRAVASIDGVELVVAGDGPERERLASLARSLSAPVRFVGHVSPTDRDALFASADVFVAPTRALGTRTEGMPTSVIEAMAAGLPIVGTRLGGLGEHVPSSASLLSDGSASSLARDLVTLRDDVTLRTTLSIGAHRAARAFDADLVAERFERLLSGLDDDRVRGERRRERGLGDPSRILDLRERHAVHRAAPVDDQHPLDRAVRTDVEPQSVDL
jgi:glycosyltransferase involved in cell wall biosynthesis